MLSFRISLGHKQEMQPLHGVRSPWDRKEAWRAEGRFTRFNRFKGAVPGFGIATIAFLAMIGIEKFYQKPAKQIVREMFFKS